VIETVSTEQVTEPKTQSLGAAPIIPTLTGETIAEIDQVTGALNVKITIPQVNITDDAENPLQVSAETDTGTIDPPAFTSAAATANTTAG
jgi:hypothetical protein